MSDTVFKAILFFPAFLFALCFHEFAHAYVAHRKGDDTAKFMGRLTMNPAAHLDWLGSLVFPAMGFFLGGFLFGWAKPVPVQLRQLKKPTEDMAWIAAAGPLSNLFLASLGAIFLGLSFAWLSNLSLFSTLTTFVVLFIQINLSLAVFNMIPLPPLDGSRVLAPFLSFRARQFLEQAESYAPFILIALVVSGALRILVVPISIMFQGLLMVAQTLGGALA